MDLDHDVMVAEQLARSGDVDGALRRLHRVLSVDPDHVGALSAAAFAYPQPARNDEALRAARRAATLTGSPHEVVNLALILAHTDEPDMQVEAERIAASQLPLVDGDPHFLSMIAFCHQFTNYDRAHALAGQAEALQPGPAALGLIAGIYAGDGRRSTQDQSWRRAESILRWLLSVDPNDEMAHRTLTDLMLTQERFDEALDAASVGARTAPHRMGELPGAIAFGVLVGAAWGWVALNFLVLFLAVRIGLPPGATTLLVGGVVLLIALGLLVVQGHRRGWRNLWRMAKFAVRFHPMAAWLPPLLVPLPVLLYWAQETWSTDAGPALGFVAFTLGSAAFLPTSSGMAERTGAIWEHPSVLLAYLTRRAAWMGLVAWVAVVPVGAGMPWPGAVVLVGGLCFFGLGWPALFHRRAPAARDLLSTARSRHGLAALAVGTVALFGLALTRAWLPTAAAIAVFGLLVGALVLAGRTLRREVGRAK